MASCAACGEELSGAFRFCPHCGAALETRAAGKEMRERKVVSVLFCDLVGFTAASESADPEEVAARVAPYHAAVRDRIEAFGGTVEKFIGDAVMAVFGAPVAHEDDAERAVRAGLAVLETIEELNVGDASLALSVRVGVNTGEAVVALDVRPELGEGMVTGDVVNTAARIQAQAPIDGVAGLRLRAAGSDLRRSCSATAATWRVLPPHSIYCRPFTTTKAIRAHWRRPSRRWRSSPSVRAQPS